MKSLRSAQRYTAVLKVRHHEVGLVECPILNHVHVDCPQQTLEQQTAEREARCAAAEAEKEVS